MATLTYSAVVNADGSVSVVSSTSGGISAGGQAAFLISDGNTFPYLHQIFEAIHRRISRDRSAYMFKDLTQASAAAPVTTTE